MKFKINLTISILAVVLAAACLGGTTMAWFAAQTGGEDMVFTAGTVIVGDPVLSQTEEVSLKCCCPPPPSNYHDLQWDIQNIGSKRARFRVRLIESYSGCGSETAWGVAQCCSSSFGTSNAKYFSYKKGSRNACCPYIVTLGQGSTYIPVGTVSVWDDGNKIYIKVKTSNSFSLDDTHLYAGLVPPNNSAPGQLGYSAVPSDPNEYIYELDSVYNSQGSSEKTLFSELNNYESVYIALHAVVACPPEPVTYTQADCGGYNWVKGSDGYWYYDSPVAAGETISICFTFELPNDYSSGSYSVSLDAEAVQASHDAMDYIWVHNPF